MGEKKKKSNLKTMIQVAIAVLIAIVITVIVIYIVEKSTSAEEMVKKAEIANWETIFETNSTNKARAKELYSNKLFISNVFVSKIATNYCVCYVTNILGEYFKQSIEVYLPSKELAKINIGDTIQVVGSLDTNIGISLKSAKIVKIIEKAED